MGYLITDMDYILDGLDVYFVEVPKTKDYSIFIAIGLNLLWYVVYKVLDLLT